MTTAINHDIQEQLKQLRKRLAQCRGSINHLNTDHENALLNEQCIIYKQEINRARQLLDYQKPRMNRGKTDFKV